MSQLAGLGILGETYTLLSAVSGLSGVGAESAVLTALSLKLATVPGLFEVKSLKVDQGCQLEYKLLPTLHQQ